MKISEILLKYQTDKNHATIKNIYNNLDERIIIDNAQPTIGHSYGAAYDEIFDTFDKKSHLNILEIGIQKGGSLVAWKEFFPNANIYGVDIVDNILDEYRNSNFHYIISDIKSDFTKNKLQNLNFDIIIDDGSHLLNDVIFVINTYLNSLNINGYFIVEDCQNPEHWIDEIKKIIPNNYEFFIKDLRQNIAYDNFLIILKRIS